MTTKSTMPQTIVVGDMPANWSQILDFGQFDPSLGTLVDVRITLIGDVAGFAAVENLSPRGGTVGIGFPGVISIVQGTAGIYSAVTVDPTTTLNLGAYDGTTDYAGNSGTVVTGISAAAATGSAFTLTGAAAAAFIGTGTVALTAQANVSSSQSGNANQLSLIEADVGATVVVQYDYNATATGGGGSSSGSGSTIVIATSTPPGPSIPNTTTTVPAVYTIADAVSGWSDLLPIQQFDPVLGTLRGINIALAGDIVGGLSAENLGHAPIALSVNENATIDLGLPGTAAMTVQPDLIITANLGAFDGTSDFAGPSGTTMAGLTNPYPFDATIGEGITDPTLLANFTGTGTYNIPISSVGASVENGGPMLLSGLTQLAGATVTVSYIYSAGPACFVTGTRVATPLGPVAVEALAVGQTVLTQDGRHAPIVWIGRRTLDCARHEQPDTVWPVRIAVDAFGPGAPERELFLSSEHAVAIGGVLIPVGCLANGETIHRARRETVTYWHVELDRHDVLLAEGLAVESFLDTGNRSAFDNGGGAVQMHPDFAVRQWEAAGYAPLVVTGPVLDAVREKLAATAVELRRAAQPTAAPRRSRSTSERTRRPLGRSVGWS